MCQKCDELNSNPNQLNEDQLYEHHLDLMMEISHLTIENIANQKRLEMLAVRLHEVESELDFRYSKASEITN